MTDTRPATVRYAALLRSSVEQLFGAVLVTQAAGIALAMMAQILIARATGAEQFGVYSLMTAIAGAAAIAARGGWDSTVVRFGAPAYSYGEYGTWDALLRAARRAAAMGSLLACMGAVVASSTVSIARGLHLEANVLAATAALVAFLAQTGLSQAKLLAMGIGWRAFTPEYLLRPLSLLAGAVFLHAYGEATATSALVIAASASALAWWFGSRLLKELSVKHAVPTASAGRSPEWAKNSRNQLKFNGAYQALAYADIFMAGILLSGADLGHYAAVRTLASFGTFALVSMQNAVTPKLAALLHAREYTAVNQLSRKIAVMATAFCCIFGVSLLVAAPYVLGLFGSGFADTVPSLAVLLVAQVVNSIAGPAGAVTAMAGLQSRATHWYIVATLMALVIATTATAAWGAIGVAVGALAATMTWTVGVVRLIRAQPGLSDWFWKRSAFRMR